LPDTQYIIRPMKAEIIAIGTELLLGDIVNLNAAYLSQQLAGLGIDVFYHSVVGDNPSRINSSIKLALSRADIVITTGGLGPTVDDVTASVIKTYVLNNALTLKNNRGTVPGQFIKLPDNKFLIALPGPPKEMKPMFRKSVVPLLKNISGFKSVIKSRVLKITGLSEPKVNKKAKDLLELKPPVTVGIYAKLGEVDLKITAKAESEARTLKLIAPIEKKIRKRLNDYIFGADEQTLEGVVGEKLLKSKKNMAIAESCTGGLIANRITDVPGSSKYFKTGIIAYSNQAKELLLDVPPGIIERYGAVSKQVAVKMAQGARRIFNADIGISVTGIAGPTGATKNKPLGLVFIALSKNNKTICKEFRFPGDRVTVKWQASQAALDMLRTSLRG